MFMAISLICSLWHGWKQQKSTATVASKARPGKSLSGLLDDIDEMDDDSSSYGKTAKSLEAYRGLYDSVKQSAGNAVAKKQKNRAHAGEEEEDFVQRSLMRQKREADPANRAPDSKQADGSDRDQGMEVDEHLQAGPFATTGTAATVRQPLQAHHVEPTRPEDVTKDTEFLQAATKARKGAKELDEFDLEFNALKIAKPKTAQAPKIYGAGLFDPSRIYNSVLNLDSDVTGNFIKIERVNLFRKDKDQQQEVPPDYDWAGRPNFKKFRKVRVSCDVMVSMLKRHDVYSRPSIERLQSSSNSHRLRITVLDLVSDMGKTRDDL